MHSAKWLRWDRLSTRVFLLGFSLYAAFAIASIVIGFRQVVILHPPALPPEVLRNLAAQLRTGTLTPEASEQFRSIPPPLRPFLQRLPTGPSPGAAQPPAAPPPDLRTPPGATPHELSDDAWSWLKDWNKGIPLPRLPRLRELKLPSRSQIILETIGLQLLPSLVNLSFGLFLVWRRSGEWVARLLGLGMVGTAAAFFYPAHFALLNASSLLVAGHITTHAIAGVTYIHGLLLFPDGRLALRHAVWFLATTYVLAAVIAILSFPYASTLGLGVVGTTHIPGVEFQERVLYLVFFGLLIPATGIVSQVHRFFRFSSAEDRQRGKFLVWGLSLTFGVGLVVVVLGTVLYTAQIGGVTGDTLRHSNRLVFNYLPPFFALVPIILSIAIVRHRLFNMDVVIHRTLVYTPLTALVAGIYIASIGILQRLIVGAIGRRSELAIGLATLVAAALFTPLKSWLQTFVDRRFREQTDPAKRLLAFRDEIRSVLQVTNVEALTDRLLREAADACGATKGAVYVREQGRLSLARSVGEWDNEPSLVLPMTWNGEELGRLCLGSRRHGLGYTDHERAALQAVLDEIAIAMHVIGRNTKDGA